MAKVYRQSGEYKAEFSKRIQEKQVMQEHRVRQRVEAAVPQWAGWLLKPLATGMARARQNKATQRGDGGEFSVGLHLWARLPKEWAVINDVVLEYQPGDYTQLDHVAIGPSGIFLVETKAWTSAVLLKNDRCFRKEAGRWVPTSSPIAQQKSHLRRFRQWYRGHGLPHPIPPIEAVVVFTHTSWLRTDGCSIPVGTPAQGVSYMRRAAGGQMGTAQIECIVHEILTPTAVLTEQADPRRRALPSSNNEVQIVEGTTRAGRRYVRIRGTREDSQQVWERYGKPGRLAADRYQQGTFFFYCD